MTIRSFFSSLKCWGNSQEEQSGTMLEIDSGVHTINFRPMFFSKHKYDWIVLVILIGTDIGLNFISPFYRFVGKDMIMIDLKYPLKANTILFWYVWLYAVVFPYIVIVCFYFKRRCVYDLNHGILGFVYAILITAVITDSIILAIGRPRPNFYWRCFPDGKELYDALGNVICHGKAKMVKEGYKSFPSRHTSVSFAGLGFLSLYLAGKIKAFNREGHVAKLCIVVFPLLVACFTGISRVDDYWNHWSDVFVGALIGLIVAIFCYRQFYPNPNHEEGWTPYAYFKAAQELEVPESLRARSLQMDSTSLDNMESGIHMVPR